MLFIRSLEFIHLILITESLWPWTNISSSPPLSPVPAPGNHHFTFCFDQFEFFRFHLVSEIIYSIYFFVSGLFYLVRCPLGSSMLLQMAWFSFLQIIFFIHSSLKHLVIVTNASVNMKVQTTLLDIDFIYFR